MASLVPTCSAGSPERSPSALTVEWLRQRTGTETVYNLEIAGRHAYTVGASAVVVHNACPDGVGVATPKKVHGNTAGRQPADLYERYDADHNFEKYGVSQDARTRYTEPELNGGYVKVIDHGPRDEMLKKERDLVERQPGPLNREPWAGKRRGQ